MPDEVAALVVRLEARIAQYERDLARARRTTDRSMGGIDRRIRSSSRSFDSLRRSVVSYGAAAAAALSAREIIGYTDALKVLKNELRQVEESEADVTAVTEELFQVAQRSRGAIADTVDTYRTLRQSTAELNLSQSELVRITETIQKSAPGASGAVRQLGQALGSGALRGDELNSVLEGAPLIARAVAAEFGVTIGQLRELAAQGEVTTDRVVAALQTLGTQADANIAKTELTVSQALQSLDNAFTVFVGGADESLGASARLAQGIELLANNLDTVGDAFVVIAAVLAGRATPAIIGMGTAALAGGTRMAVLSRAIQILGVRATASAVAVRGLRAALAFFGGPIGLAVTATAGAVYFLATRTDEATSAMDRARDALEGVRDVDARLANEKRKLADLNARLGESETAAAALAVDASNKRVEALEREQRAKRATFALQVAELESITSNFAGQQTNALTGFAIRAQKDEGLAGLIEDRPSFESLAERIIERAKAGEKLADEERQILELYKTQAEVLSRQAAFKEALEQANDGFGRTTLPESTGATKTEKTLDADRDAAESLRSEIELLANEYERYRRIANDRGIAIGSNDNFSDLSENERIELEATALTRLERARKTAAEGLGDQAEKAEALRIGLERIKDQIGDLSKAEQEALKERESATKAAAEAARREAESVQERKDSAKAAIAALRQQISDEIRIQSARAQGSEQEKDARRQIEARIAATRLATEAQKAGLDITKEALQAEFIASKESIDAWNARADALERNRETAERIAGLQRDLNGAGPSVAGAGEISGASTIADLDAVLEAVKAENLERERAAEIAEAEEAVRVRIRNAHAEELPVLQAELDLVRQVLEAKHGQTDAERQSSEAARERRTELERVAQVEAKIAEASQSAEEAAQRAKIEAVAASGALEAKNLDDLRLVTEEREKALAALERELAIKREIAGLGDGATPQDIGRTRDATGDRFDSEQAEKSHNDVLKERTTILKGHEEANKRIVQGIFQAIEGAESFEDALKKIGLQFLEIAAQGFFNGAFGAPGAGSAGGGLGGVAASIGSSVLGSIFSGASFEGGGSTGGGPRSGGLDGRGGFLAMLHPQETVIDRSRGQSAGGSNIINMGDIVVQGGADRSALREIERLQRGQVDMISAALDKQRAQGLR